MAPKTRAKAKVPSRKSTQFSQLDTTPTSRDRQGLHSENGPNTDAAGNSLSHTKAMDMAFDLPSPFDDEGIDDAALLETDKQPQATNNTVSKGFPWSDIESGVRPSSPIPDTYDMSEPWELDGTDVPLASNEGLANSELPDTIQIPPSNTLRTIANSPHFVDFSETASTGRRSSPAGDIADTGSYPWDFELDASSEDAETKLNSTLNRGNNTHTTQLITISPTSENRKRAINSEIMSPSPSPKPNQVASKTIARKTTRIKQKAKSPLQFDEDTQTIKPRNQTVKSIEKLGYGAKSATIASPQPPRPKSKVKKPVPAKTTAKDTVTGKNVVSTDRVTRSQKMKNDKNSTNDEIDKALSTESKSPDVSPQTTVDKGNGSLQSASIIQTPQSNSNISENSSPFTIPDRSVAFEPGRLATIDMQRELDSQSEDDSLREAKSVIPCSEVASPERQSFVDDLEDDFLTSTKFGNGYSDGEQLRDLSPSISLGNSRRTATSPSNYGTNLKSKSHITISSDVSSSSHTDDDHTPLGTNTSSQVDPKITQSRSIPNMNSQPQVEKFTKGITKTTAGQGMRDRLYTRIKSLPVTASQASVDNHNGQSSKLYLEQQLHWTAEVRHLQSIMN
ncbi:hypothetical protein VHEMI09386 [[Torrubiella] hemipterigena]|uniref:Uncharacterized protein n=1 Tax=[Torrubiella] hemipterigena TaxID=1531966 RepID=A0A0A1TG89_9HYPO|nr:hypothetical protein VHEMI09386 [[Torrubiella] hemipterigena]